MVVARARGSTRSNPLEWERLKFCKSSKEFNIDTAPDALDWVGFKDKPQHLSANLIGFLVGQAS